MNVLFYLPSGGGGGGAYSVAQEAIGMRRFGVSTTIVNTSKNFATFRINHPEVETSGVRLGGVENPAELAQMLPGQDVACATTFESAHDLKAALDVMKGEKPRAAYYIQDYEPLFCVPSSPRWERAHASYRALDGALLFAKTKWLCDVVEENTGRPVEKVMPSIDHAVYFPGDRPRQPRLVITAMIRPKTPRRAPHRTARILQLLAHRYGDKVQVLAFGAPRSELEESGIHLPAAVDVRGSLSRQQVAGLLRVSDLFLDLSDYQAFGRTGLEAMACGSVSMLPVFGGAHEYARHWRNAILVDVRSDRRILEEVERFIDLSVADRERMQSAAIETALQYTIERAAFSERELFRKHLAAA